MRRTKSRARMRETVAARESIPIDDGAVRYIRPVVHDYRTMSPVKSPMMPTPSKAAEESHAEPEPERNAWRCDVETWIRIPAGPRHHRAAICYPRIVRRHIDHIRSSRFNNNRVSLFCHVLLRIAVEISALLSALTHLLNGIHNILLLYHVTLTQRRCPGQVLIHVRQYGWELC